MAVNKNKVFYCNIELALDIVGGKWKPLIVYHLSYNPVLRFGAFKRLIPDVNERVLARQLKDLEENKIIKRKDYYENPPRVEYSLTKAGEKLSPIIIDLGNWGKSYNKDFEYGEIEFQNKYDDDHC